MSTIIIGDVAEGVKHWSVADQLKTELKTIYGKTNPSMHTWKQVDATTKIFVKLVNGQPTAFIYTNIGVPYEFSVRMETLVKYFDKKVDTKQRALSMANLGQPINIWYGKAVLKEGTPPVNVWVTGGVGRRYASPRTTYKTLLDYYPLPIDLPAVVYNEKGDIVFTSPLEVIGAATVGNMLCGISTLGVAYAWNIWDGTELYSEQILGTWDTDEDSYKAAQGYWVFNKAGNKAVATCYASQFKRFNSTDTRTIVPGGWLRSFIQEVEFGDSLILSDPIESKGFCVAADYDWTIPTNPIIYAQYRLFSYAKKAAKKWTASTEYAIGDRIVVEDPVVGGNTEVNSRVYRVEGFDYDVKTHSPGEFHYVWSASKKSGTSPPKWRAESRPLWISPDVNARISAFEPIYPEGTNPSAILRPRRRDGGLWLVEEEPIDSRDLRVDIRHADGTQIIDFSAEQNSVNAYSTGVGTDKDWWFSLRNGADGMHNVAGAFDLRIQSYAVADIYGESAKIGAYGQEYLANNSPVSDGDGVYLPNAYEVLSYLSADATAHAAIQALGELATLIDAYNNLYNNSSWVSESTYKPSPLGNHNVAFSVTFPHIFAEHISNPGVAAFWERKIANIAFFVSRVAAHLDQVNPDEFLLPFDAAKTKLELLKINDLAATLPTFIASAHDTILTYPSGNSGDPVTEAQYLEIYDIVSGAYRSETEVYDKIQDIITSVREVLSDAGTAWRGRIAIGDPPAAVALPYLFVDEAHLKNLALYINTYDLGVYSTLQVDLLVDDKGAKHYGYHQALASGATYDIFRLAGAWVAPLIENPQ